MDDNTRDSYMTLEMKILEETKYARKIALEEGLKQGVVNGRFCPKSVRNFCPIVAGFNAGTYKVPACVL